MSKKEITNNGTAAITIFGFDGDNDSIMGGETKSVSYDPKNPHNVAKFAMGAASFKGGEVNMASPAPRSASKKSAKGAAKSAGKGRGRAKKSPEAPVVEDPASEE